MNNPRILVIGGTGFIGGHLVKHAAALGWQVDSLSLHQPDSDSRVPEVNYIKADLRRLDQLQEKLDTAYTYVVNLGGYIDHSPFEEGGRNLIETHLTGLQNLVQAIPRSNLKRFVHVGSSDEYGDAPAPQSEDLRESPISPYSFAKAAGTHFLQMLYRSEEFPAAVVRLFLTYGPGQDSRRFLPQIIKGCLNDEEFPTSGGEQERDFCYVGDTIEAIIAVLKHEDAAGEIFNVASGNPVQIKTMVEKIQKAIGAGTPKFGEIPYRPGENMSLYADISKIKHRLGWSPQTSLDEGIQKTIRYFKEEHTHG